MYDDPRKARVTVLVKTHYENPNEPTCSADDVTYSELLATDEQAYSRSLTVGEAWEPVDTGWLTGKGVAFLSIRNCYRPHKGLTFSPQDRIEGETKTLEVGKTVYTADGTTEVIPVFAVPFEFGVTLCPLGIDRFRIRCVNGTGRYSVFAVPEEGVRGEDGGQQ